MISKKQKLENLLVKYSSSRVEMGKLNIEWFARYYLNKLISSRLAPFQKDILALLKHNKRLVIVAPRQHGKTSLLIAYLLWCVLYQTRRYMLIICSTATNAESLLANIVIELETNKRILEDFGNICGWLPMSKQVKTKWSTRDIVTLNGVKISARGIESKLRGLLWNSKRPDVFIDDIESDEAVRSSELRDKLMQLWKKVILNIPDINGTIYIQGTLLHHDSLLNNLLIKPPSGFISKVYRALKKGKPIFPSRFTIEKLAEIKAQVGSAWSQEYMNRIISSEEQIFKIKNWYKEMNFDDFLYYGAIDLSVGEKVTNDYTSIFTCGRHKETGKIHVINCVKFRGNIQNCLGKVFLEYNKYHWQSFAVEIVSYQKVFSQLLQAESEKQGIYIPIIEVQTKGMDKIQRAIPISVLVENGSILFPESEAESDWIREITEFPLSRFDDVVDSFVYCIGIIQNRGTGHIASAARQVSEKEMNGYYCSGNRYGEQSDIFGGPSENEIKHKQMMVQSIRRGKSVPFL